jgi:hypothetical protein
MLTTGHSLEIILAVAKTRHGVPDPDTSLELSLKKVTLIED